jgi:hypothetical protein
MSKAHDPMTSGVNELSSCCSISGPKRRYEQDRVASQLEVMLRNGLPANYVNAMSGDISVRFSASVWHRAHRPAREGFGEGSRLSIYLEGGRRRTL